MLRHGAVGAGDWRQGPSGVVHAARRTRNLPAIPGAHPRRGAWWLRAALRRSAAKHDNDDDDDANQDVHEDFIDHDVDQHDNSDEHADVNDPNVHDADVDDADEHLNHLENDNKLYVHEFDDDHNDLVDAGLDHDGPSHNNQLDGDNDILDFYIDHKHRYDHDAHVHHGDEHDNGDGHLDDISDDDVCHNDGHHDDGHHDDCYPDDVNHHHDHGILEHDHVNQNDYPHVNAHVDYSDDHRDDNHNNLRPEAELRLAIAVLLLRDAGPRLGAGAHRAAVGEENVHIRVRRFRGDRPEAAELGEG
mmetsp:Transcript_30557/g.88557  ORF Transcript_30557/g.88557 Transcript_30557/m.88557 type:complete len:303 (+) Transcript_30557:609-1517(+)